MTDRLRQLDNALKPWCDVTSLDFDAADVRWQALPIDERRRYLLMAQERDELIVGYSCVGVFPVDETGFHFAYTTGLDINIVVTGLSSSGAGVLAMAVNHRFQRDGHPFTVGEGRLVFAPVPEDWAQANMRGATTARQIIYQDDAGHWPWDRDGPPVLVGPDWRPEEG